MSELCSYMKVYDAYITRQAGMRLDYKNSAHSKNCSVLANRIVKRTSFSRSSVYKRAVGSLVWLSA